MQKFSLIILLIFHLSAYAADDADYLLGPIQNLTDLLSGPVGAALMVLALVGSGFMFFIGKWDVMRLVATAIGSGLIFGGATLADTLMN